MNATHDPRINPQPGDSVTVGGETREVELVRDGRVYYSWPGKVAVRSLFASAWSTWAQEASAWHATESQAA